jgi:DNA mismatch repair protein MutS
MTNTGDLHIEEEILPLFDYTFNLFSGKAVHQLVTEPPGTLEDILYRQQVLKGFIGNYEIWKEYSFSRFNLSEIYDFFETFGVGHFFAQNMRWKLRFSEKERGRNRGRLILLIRLFSKIQADYLEKLDTKLFPPEYAAELDLLNRFLIDFDLAHYEKIYNKKNLKVSHIVELMGIITEKVTNGQAAAFWKRWFLFEAYLSVSKGIVEHGFVFPSFETATFSIQGVYHPLLKNPVRNDISAMVRAARTTLSEPLRGHDSQRSFSGRTVREDTNRSGKGSLVFYWQMVIVDGFIPSSAMVRVPRTT